MPCGRNSGLRWYVVYTHPQAERLATRDLTDKGYRVYLPMQVIKRRDRVVRSMFHTVHVPMFSRYLFVEFDADRDPWTPVRYADGVRELFMAQGSMRPLPVPVGYVEWLIENAASRLNLPTEKGDVLEKGSQVRIDVGPFASFFGQVLACDGLTTLVEASIFGRETKVTLARSGVTPI